MAAGGEAVEAILNFTSSIEAIEEAINITTETSEMLEQVLVEVGRVGMGSGDLDREVATELLVMSQTLLREAKDEAARADSESGKLVFYVNVIGTIIHVHVPV